MFSKEVLSRLLKENSSFFSNLVEIRKILNSRFVGMEDQVQCLILAVASGESMLMIGPPGTAKSRLIRAFAQMAKLIDDSELSGGHAGQKDKRAKAFERNDRYFEYLLTPFTEPGELFGFFDIAKLMQTGEGGGELMRLDTGMMQHAEVVFLDEVFNASSAILNSLLTFVNERKFHDRGKSYEVKLSSLFGATNFPPKRSELLAIFDRFLLRSWAENADPEPSDIGELLRAGWTETNAANTNKTFPLILDEAAAFRQSLSRLSAEGVLTIKPDDDDTAELVTRLATIVDQARRSRLSLLSNRRLVRFSKVFLVHALLRAAENQSTKPTIGVHEELMLMVKYGLDRQPDPVQIDQFKSLLVGSVTG